MTEDFDIDIVDINLVHKMVYFPEYIHNLLKKRRNVAGFVFCLSGEALYDFGSNSFTLSEGEMVFLPSNSHYTAKNINSEPFVHITANFYITFNCPQTDSIAYKILSGKTVYISGKKHSSEFKMLLEKLLNVWKNKKSGYPIIAKSILYEILYMFFASASRELENNSDYDKISKAKKIIAAALPSDISISEIAESCQMSQSHFRRTFRKVTGFSPMEYKMNLIIEKGKELLLTQDIPISEIAQKIGLDDANYFSRIFKKHVGMSPSQYRIQILGIRR